MSDEAQRMTEVTLERPARLAPSWRRRFAWLTVGIGIAVAIGLYLKITRPDASPAAVDPGPDCATAVRNAAASAASAANAVQLCRAAYLSTSNPMIGARLAMALYMSRDLAGAKQQATSLLLTPARSDALQISGRVANAEDRPDDAIAALEQARPLHRVEQQPGKLARDDALLALIRVDRGEFAEALQLADECIKAAELDGDPWLQLSCHLTAAKILIRVGYWQAAEHELDTAKGLAVTDQQRSDLDYQRASFEQERGQHATAIAIFTNALHSRAGSSDAQWTTKTELNVAYSYAELGKIADARSHLASAGAHDPDHKAERDRTWVAAQIAYRDHDLLDAKLLAERYFKLLGQDGSGDRDNQIDVASLHARIDLERGDLTAAAVWAQRGVDHAESIRKAQPTLELRPWILTKRRLPYELLFTALARDKQVAAAAMAFDQWQGRTVQDALTRPQAPASGSLRGIADQVTRLGRWLSAASYAAFAAPADRAAVLSAMQGIDLLALIVANGDVWALTANHGPPRLSRLAALADVKDRVDKFRGDPTEVKLGSQLGALLLPSDSFRATPDVLHVIVDSQLEGLPVSALRQGTTPLIEVRPVTHLLRLPETRCVRAARPGNATVIGVPDAKSPKAGIEAEEVAALLHTTAETGAAGTKPALFAAGGGGVLHVAAHGAAGKDGAAIVLADGELSALEISAHFSAQRSAPSLVVLSVCDAAASDKFEISSSLAAAFLAGGSQHVVATLGGISDSGALKIAPLFYKAGGVDDPIHALASVQAALATTGDRDWPRFAAFGPAVCPDGTPDH